MLKVGLTGNIGSGKTLVSEIFRTLKVPVFHADDEAKKLYLDPVIRKELAGILGPSIFDTEGRLDRGRMASLVFNDEKLLSRVNALIHPRVRESFTAMTLETSAPYIIYEAAILIESGYFRELDRLILVSAPEPIRLERVMKRDGVTEQEVRQRMLRQLPEQDKLTLADWVIANDGSRLVIPQVLQINEELRNIPS